MRRGPRSRSAQAVKIQRRDPHTAQPAGQTVATRPPWQPLARPPPRRRALDRPARRAPMNFKSAQGRIPTGVRLYSTRAYTHARRRHSPYWRTGVITDLARRPAIQASIHPSRRPARCWPVSQFRSATTRVRCCSTQAGDEAGGVCGALCARARDGRGRPGPRQHPGKRQERLRVRPRPPDGQPRRAPPSCPGLLV